MPSFHVYSALANDLRPDGQRNITVLEDEDAVGASVENILQTHVGERVMRRDFGSDVPDLLFEPIDEGLAGFIRMAIFQDLRRNGEDRLVIDGLAVAADPDRNIYYLTVQYRLKDLGSQRFEFARILHSLEAS